MFAFVSLIPLIYLLAAIPYASLGIYAWLRRPAAAVTPFAWMMLAMAIWSAGYSLEILSLDIQTKLRFEILLYFSVVSIPVFFLIFALEFSGRGHLLTPRNRVLLWIIPLVILFLILTNEIHELMWDSATIKERFGLSLLAVRPQIFFWLNVAYSYSLLLTATFLLIMEVVQRPGIYRYQAVLVIIGLLFPWIGNVIYLAGFGPIPDFDLTVLFFIPTGLALGWAITRYRLLDVIPPEHITILQNMRDGLIVVDTGQRILYLNPIAETLFAKTEATAIGQPLDCLSAEFSSIISANLSAREIQFEYFFDKQNKNPVFEITLSPIYSSKLTSATRPAGYVFNLHDISLRKQAELALARREAILSAISLTAEQFLKESSWEYNIPHMLEKIGRATDASRVYVAMNYSNEEGVLHTSLCYEWTVPGTTSRINDPTLQHVQLEKSGLERWEKLLGRGDSISGLVREFPEPEQKFLQPYQVVSMIAVPIFADNQWWGFIGMDECRCERVWTSNEMDALHVLANVFGAAETRTRAEQKLLHRQHTLNILHDIVVLSLKASNLQSMSQELVDHMGELMKADGCFLALWDESYRQVVPLSAYRADKEKYLSFHPKPTDSTFTASVLEAARPLVIEDVQNSPMQNYSFLEIFPTKSLIVFPLISSGDRLGSIILAYHRSRFFPEEEIEVGQQASDLIALSLEKFQAMEHASRRAEEAETLRKAGAFVTETLDTEEVVRRILNQLAEVIPYDTASVQILDGNELKVVGGHGWGVEKQIVGARYPIPGNNPNAVVIQTGKPYFEPDIREKYIPFDNPLDDHIRSWLGVPLIVQGRIIGLLAAHSSKPNHFTRENIELATAFADQVAVNLEHTRLFEEAQSQALTDPLTGLYNRRGLFELGKVEFARSARMNRPFSGIMIDLDNFKQVNDTYGHSVGDQVLCELASRCKSCVREIDFVCRYGGEEIIILLPETNRNAALEVAERLRLAIASQPMQVEQNLALNITASLGVAQRDENTTTLEMLIARADQAMYIAKHKGRNRVASSV